MKNKAKWLCSVLLLMAVIVSGCGKSGGEGSGSPSAGSEPVSSEAPDPAASGANSVQDEKFTIRLGGWFIDDRPFMVDFKKNVEDQYKQKYPNATIQWDILLGATYFDKLKAELASKTAPDVFFHNTMFGEIVEAGYVMDISDQPWVQSLQPAAKSLLSIGGKVYAGALGQGSNGFWYNKKIYADLGLQVPKTWDEFLANGRKIKEAGIVPVALGFKDLWTAGTIFRGFAQSIGYESSPTFGRDLFAGKKTLDGPEMQAVMNRFQNLTEEGFFNKNALSLDWPQSAELVSTGQAAMIFQSQFLPSAIYDNFKNKGHAEFELGYFPAPTDKGFYSLPAGVSEMISVNSSTELKQQALDLVAVILSQETLAGYSAGNGSVPVLKNIEVKYPYAAQNEMLAALQSGNVSLDFQLFVAKSALGDINELVSKTVSGVGFDVKDLQEIQKKHERDKSTLVVPEE